MEKIKILKKWTTQKLVNEKERKETQQRSTVIGNHVPTRAFRNETGSHFSTQYNKSWARTRRELAKLTSDDYLECTLCCWGFLSLLFYFSILWTWARSLSRKSLGWVIVWIIYCTYGPKLDRLNLPISCLF